MLKESDSGVELLLFLPLLFLLMQLNWATCVKLLKALHLQRCSPMSQALEPLQDSDGCSQVGWGGLDLLLYSLYAVFGRSTGLVKLVGIVKLVLTGGVGKIWHRVRRQRDVSRGGDATAGAWGTTPWEEGRKKTTHSTSVDIAHRCFFEVKNSFPEPSPAADEQQPVFNTVIASSAERIDGPSEHAACLPNAQHSVLILLPQHTR